MTPQVHLVVQDSADFDDAPFGNTIDKEVTSTPTVPGNMQRAKA